MSYRLKNSDFKPFLGFLEGKVNDLWVYMGEGIGVYFGIFLSGKSIPRVGGKRIENWSNGLDGMERR